MEPNLPVIGKQFWNIVRVALLILRKGISSKRKLMLDLNMMMKRGKIAGKALQNLMFHHHQSSPSRHVSFPAAPGYYEFSCSNTPQPQSIFPFHNKRKHNNHSHFFSCAHAPPTEDEILTVDEVVNAFEDASPSLPGFGLSPVVRQLRITDSPFPLRDIDEEDNQVDKAADEFIAKFYNQLRHQNKMADSNSYHVN